MSRVYTGWEGGGGAEIYPTVILYEILCTAVIDLLHYVYACMYNLMCLMDT